MDKFRRNLLKFSPLAVTTAAVIGRTALAEAPSTLEAQLTFNVRTYGASGDGKTIDTPAINRAIEAVAAAGGGTLVFPAGTYLSGQCQVLGWDQERLLARRRLDSSVARSIQRSISIFMTS
jgi:hypothetical protein